MEKKRILIVDDEVGITKLLKFALERSGRFEVSCVHEGKNALAAVKSFLPDLILLDVNLPDAQGGDVEAEIKEEPAFRKVPIIFLTGMISSEEAQSGLTIGGRPAFAKPIDLEKLIEFVDQQLQG